MDMTLEDMEKKLHSAHTSFFYFFPAALRYQFCWSKAYSCGWKKAKAENPTDSSASRTGGKTRKAECLAELKAAGVKVAQDYTLRDP